jgi:hypothetical protein
LRNTTKVGTRININTNSKHMMASDEESNEGDRTDGPTHACPIEETKGTVILQYVTDK